MIKNNLIIILATTLFFSGCVEKKLNTPSVSNLSDVEYKVNKNGDISLEKTHIFKDGNSTKKSEEVTSNFNKIDSKNYEIVPNFEKNYNKELSLKKKKRKKEKKIIVRGAKVKVSVESIPINEFIDLIFSSVLKLNYTVSNEIKGLKAPITLNMTNLQPKQEVFDVVTKLLSFNGVTLKKENGVIFLSKASAKKIISDRENNYIGYGRKVKDDVSDEQDIIMFIPFDYITSKKAVTLLKYAGISRSVFNYPSNKILLMKNTASEVRRAIDIIKLIDRPYMNGKTPYLIKLDNIEVNDFITRMKIILSSNGITIVSSPLNTGVLMTPIPELNSLFVISPKKSWIDMVLYWKNKLDTVSEISPNPKFYTYKVQNRKADELAEALSAIIEIKLSTLKIEKNKLEKMKEIKKQSLEKLDHSIIADLPTNTLMMQLLPSEYREILPLIEELDALPLQVLVEVTLAEVTLTDTFNLGFEYALRNDASVGVLSIPEAIISSAFGGSGFSATYNSKNLDIVMNAYAEDKLLSIMSKPKILILNNQTGSINVGTQIPIVSSESSAADIGTSGDPSILRNISYRNTGVVVGLSPTINSNGILTMNVNLQLSEAQLNDTSSIDSPLIVNRSLSTSLTLKHGETIMLGGLISKNKSTTDSGVPYLMDIPWLGSIFQSQSEKIVKTELIMLIKPFIIETPSQMSKKTKSYRAILTLLDKYSLF